MSARDDMHRHFTAISPVYRSVRTTDREPVEWIARELNGLARPKGADIGCGAGRYVLSMFEMIPNLSLTCVDTTPAMLEQVDGLLRANGIDGFETRQSTAECLELEPGGFDFVSSFNAVHHFDFPQFLRRSRDGLAKDGRLFVYTRLNDGTGRLRCDACVVLCAGNATRWLNSRYSATTSRPVSAWNPPWAQRP